MRPGALVATIDLDARGAAPRGHGVLSRSPSLALQPDRRGTLSGKVGRNRHHRYLIALGSNMRHHRHGAPERACCGAALGRARSGRGWRWRGSLADHRQSAPLGPSLPPLCQRGRPPCDTRLAPPELLATLQQDRARSSAAAAGGAQVARAHPRSRHRACGDGGAFSRAWPDDPPSQSSATRRLRAHPGAPHVAARLARPADRPVAASPARTLDPFPCRALGDRRRPRRRQLPGRALSSVGRAT